MKRKGRKILLMLTTMLCAIWIWNPVLASKKVETNVQYENYVSEDMEFEVYLKEFKKKDTNFSMYSSISYEEGTAVFYIKYDGNIVAEIAADFKFSYNDIVATVEYMRTPEIEIYISTSSGVCLQLYLLDTFFKMPQWIFVKPELTDVRINIYIPYPVYSIL